MSTSDADLSRLLFEARELVSMFTDVVESQTGRTEAWGRRVTADLDAYRAERGWSPDGYGGETSSTVDIADLVVIRVRPSSFGSRDGWEWAVDWIWEWDIHASGWCESRERAEREARFAYRMRIKRYRERMARASEVPGRGWEEITDEQAP